MYTSKDPSNLIQFTKFRVEFDVFFFPVVWRSINYFVVGNALFRSLSLLSPHWTPTQYIICLNRANSSGLFFILLLVTEIPNFFLRPVHCIAAICPAAINLRPKESWWKIFQIKINFQPLFGKKIGGIRLVKPSFKKKYSNGWIKEKVRKYKTNNEERKKKTPNSIATRVEMFTFSLKYVFRFVFIFFVFVHPFFLFHRCVTSSQIDFDNANWNSKGNINKTFATSNNNSNPCQSIHSFFNYLSISLKKKGETISGKNNDQKHKTGWAVKIKSSSNKSNANKFFISIHPHVPVKQFIMWTETIARWFWFGMWHRCCICFFFSSAWFLVFRLISACKLTLFFSFHIRFLRLFLFAFAFTHLQTLRFQLNK